MNILNITFNSINAEKNSMPKGKVGINNNIKINSIKETKMGLDKSNTALRVTFGFITEYTPNFAKIELKGDATALVEVEMAKKILAGWEKEKTKGLDLTFAEILLNTLMIKCSLQSIILARELNLPSPVQLPRLKLHDKPTATKPATKTAAKAKK